MEISLNQFSVSSSKFSTYHSHSTRQLDQVLAERHSDIKYEDLEHSWAQIASYRLRNEFEAVLQQKFQDKGHVPDTQLRILHIRKRVNNPSPKIGGVTWGYFDDSGKLIA